ncbi:MAG TPA: lysylphosphatidylglycerol synthase transmembrane domain-containing protein [Anaerolineales bacterium]
MSRPPGRLPRPALLRILGTGLSIALLIYLLARQGWDEIVEAVRRIPPAYLAVFLTLMVVSRFAVAARWYSLLRSTDPSISFGQSLRITFAGLFAANFLPTSVGGDVVRLAGTLQLSKDRWGSAASIVADRIVGLAGMALVLPFGVQVLIAWIRTTPMAGSMLGPILGAVPLAAILSGRRDELRGRIGRMVRRAREAMVAWLGRPGALLVALGFTGLHMICLFTAIRLLLAGMGEPIAFGSAAGLWSFSYFINLIPFSINGWGLREVSVTFIYSEIGGISLHSALALALLLRSAELAASLPGALFVPAILSGPPAQEVES